MLKMSLISFLKNSVLESKRNDFFFVLRETLNVGFCNRDQLYID